jgi:hypothetical protein
MGTEPVVFLHGNVIASGVIHLIHRYGDPAASFLDRNSNIKRLRNFVFLDDSVGKCWRWLKGEYPVDRM